MTAGEDAAVAKADTDLRWGIVGVGDMGANIARSVMEHGFGAKVFDRRREPLDELSRLGAKVVSSLEELSQSANVISVVVVDDDQVRDVITTMIDTARAGTIFIVHSTVRPSTVIDLARLAQASEMDAMDAGVTGGPEKAEIGRLTLLIGGSNESVQRCSPLLEAMGANLFHLGPAGAGVAGKLVNNLLSIGGYALQLEAMDLARAYGIAEETATSFLVVGGGDSRGIRTWGRLDRIRRTHPVFGGTPHIYEHMSKDLREAAEAGAERATILPLAAVAGELLPRKMLRRDEMLGNTTADAPRCRGCHQDLAKPFREQGFHPECVDLPTAASSTSQTPQSRHPIQQEGNSERHRP
ncbi:MAG TPA: NAD(P)-binding domain-containing protein [Acidimicrobiales bacterium]|nr:NAD(P)-binding domain-containing protein [Acidimicrobiales bacterium]